MRGGLAPQDVAQLERLAAWLEGGLYRRAVHGVSSVRMRDVRIGKHPEEWGVTLTTDGGNFLDGCGQTLGEVIAAAFAKLGSKQ